MIVGHIVSSEVNVGNFIKSFPELLQYVGEDSRDNLNQIKIEYIAHQQPSLDSSEQSRKIRASLFSNLMEAFKKILVLIMFFNWNKISISNSFL